MLRPYGNAPHLCLMAAVHLELILPQTEALGNARDLGMRIEASVRDESDMRPQGEQRDGEQGGGSQISGGKGSGAHFSHLGGSDELATGMLAARSCC